MISVTPVNVPVELLITLLTDPANKDTLLEPGVFIIELRKEEKNKRTTL